MAREHWFDSLNKLLTQDAPRRGVLSTIAALTVGPRLGATDAAAKTGGKGKKNQGKKKGKGNDKKNRKHEDKKNGNGAVPRAGAGNATEPTPNSPQSCSGGTCAQQWAGIDTEIAYCEFICDQCDENNPRPREFCIAGDPKVAVCCDLPAPNCCDGTCIDKQLDENNCGTCGNACDPGEFCHDGSCVPVCQNQNCPSGQLCYNGNNQYCSGQTTIDCNCGCGGFNYCQNPFLGWVCQSSPC